MYEPPFHYPKIVAPGDFSQSSRYPDLLPPRHMWQGQRGWLMLFAWIGSWAAARAWSSRHLGKGILGGLLFQP